MKVVTDDPVMENPCAFVPEFRAVMLEAETTAPFGVQFAEVKASTPPVTIEPLIYGVSVASLAAVVAAFSTTNFMLKILKLYPRTSEVIESAFDMSARLRKNDSVKIPTVAGTVADGVPPDESTIAEGNEPMAAWGPEQTTSEFTFTVSPTMVVSPA